MVSTINIFIVTYIAYLNVIDKTYSLKSELNMLLDIFVQDYNPINLCFPYILGIVFFFKQIITFGFLQV